MSWDNIKERYLKFAKSFELVHLVLKDSFTFVCLAIILLFLSHVLVVVSKLRPVVHSFCPVAKNIKFPAPDELINWANYLSEVGVWVLYCLYITIDIVRILIKKIINAVKFWLGKDERN
ncbi:MAG: hypothetical protein PHO70_06800 [Candidatus Omnitrophica bacterium]|nr:hypothetical protein [Candidatus Omnitrophota bacterium]